MLAGEGGRRQVFGRRTRSDRTSHWLAEPGERAGYGGRKLVGNGDRFNCPADLGAECAHRLPVIRDQARQPIEQLPDRRCLLHDPPEGIRGNTEARRYVDAFDPRKLPKLRAFATNDGDLRLVDLLETQHVVAHPATFPLGPIGPSFRLSITRTPLVRLVGCIVSTSGALATRPPPWCMFVMAVETSSPLLDYGSWAQALGPGSSTSIWLKAGTRPRRPVGKPTVARRRPTGKEPGIY